MKKSTRILSRKNLRRKNILSIRLSCSSSQSLKISSSLCAVIGGVILAANINISSFGFIFLGLSSSQLLIASVQSKDYLMMVYASSILLFVDCLGIYRWLLS